MTLAEELQYALTPKMVSLWGFSVPQSVVVSWVIIGGLGLLFWLSGHRPQQVPGTLQLVGEEFVRLMDDFVGGLVGSSVAAVLAPFFGGVALYLACANLTGLVDVPPPTKDLNVTAGLALIAFCVMYGTLVARKGVKGALRRYGEPSLLMVPFNLIDMVTRPLSLCMRLFGNIFGAYVIMTLIHFVLPVALPPIFGLYFDVFDGLIQMMVFVFLTALFTQDLLD